MSRPLAQKNSARLLKLPLSSLMAMAIFACASQKYQISDSEYYTDGFALNKNTVQLVESYEDNSLLLPAAERFTRNCESAERKARIRHKATFPLSRDEGIRLSERFDKNAGCTVRMAFRKE